MLMLLPVTDARDSYAMLTCHALIDMPLLMSQARYAAAAGLLRCHYFCRCLIRYYATLILRCAQCAHAASAMLC